MVGHSREHCEGHWCGLVERLAATLISVYSVPQHLQKHLEYPYWTTVSFLFLSFTFHLLSHSQLMTADRELAEGVVMVIYIDKWG
jgi:hypothetical protein